jgi:hypothetical protein
MSNFAEWDPFRQCGFKAQPHTCEAGRPLHGVRMPLQCYTAVRKVAGSPMTVLQHSHAKCCEQVQSRARQGASGATSPLTVKATMCCRGHPAALRHISLTDDVSDDKRGTSASDDLSDYSTDSSSKGGLQQAASRQRALQLSQPASRAAAAMPTARFGTAAVSAAPAMPSIPLQQSDEAAAPAARAAAGAGFSSGAQQRRLPAPRAGAAARQEPMSVRPPPRRPWSARAAVRPGAARLPCLRAQMDSAGNAGSAPAGRGYRNPRCASCMWNTSAHAAVAHTLGAAADPDWISQGNMGAAACRFTNSEVERQIQARRDPRRPKTITTYNAHLSKALV